MSRRRQFAWLAWLGIAVLGAVTAWHALERPPSGNWLFAFMAPMHGPIADDPLHDDRALRFSGLSLRQFAPLALPGDRVRLSISNQFGDAPLVVGGLHIAWRDGAVGAAVRAGTDRQVLFSGKQGIEIPSGATAVSDPVELPDGERSDLAVSLFLPVPTPRASWHLVGSRSSYRSTAGNHVGAVEFPVSSVDRSVYFLAAIEIDAPADSSLWVAFGDSITDGAWHTVDEDGSWPARWGQAWRRTDPGGPPVGILNAGIGGDRLLSERVGPSGMARFGRDVLEVKGVRGVVIAIGINDLGGRQYNGELPLIVGRLIATQTELARQARAKGLKVVAASLTPVGGSSYGVPEVEAARQQINRWLRETSVFDAVVDFDAVIRDPVQADRIRPHWTSDHLHPNDAGYRAMADAVVQVMARPGLSGR